MRKLISVLLIFSTLVIVSCKKENREINSENSDRFRSASVTSNANISNTYYGPQVQLGNGRVRSWISISREGEPEQIGIEMTAGALHNLPTGEHSSTLLQLHQKAKQLTPFDHINIDWEAGGHPPPGIFTVPHFDFHFYTISVADQLAIPVPDQNNMSLFTSLNAGVLPIDYSIAGGPVPQMGMHWLDRTSAVFPPTLQTFTNEFVYGTYNGNVIFYEPMITRSLLLSGTSVQREIKQPITFSKTGTYYPTMYNVYKDAKTGNVYITLSHFEFH
jgi:hypothetical protein